MILDPLQQLGRGQLPGVEVDRDRELAGPFETLLPGLHPAARLPQHPPADARREAGLLGHLEEFLRQPHASIRVAPTDQRLEAV